ncbi:MAG TPA: response regulator transcription factor [Flexilinea sp.]|jgi:DNA-binding response OmpR family regulator|nr:response regulator transcription factor [Flexilinea sp.]HNY19994.1 response regulator transcription factor [Flexilinea sp.]HOW06886.1 response regulator transcription factor [Flexilinea sp.]HPJ65452.1 response regulator transcription factor [Flexilinea sp.]HPR70798.1 response regulator transcription factor [Flexilinea sp.]
MAYKILIVDDDVLLRRSLAFNFEKCGYPANTAENAEDALAIINIDPPDLILLDIGLPGMDGLDAISEIRNSKNIPVIFLTARRSGSDQVTGLNAGADDYITKPFDFDVLLAHVKAVLRRRENPVPEPEENILQVGDLKLDFPQHKAEIGGKELELSPKEFELLTAMALNADHIISTDNLLKRVWGAEYTGDPQVLYVHIRWLRSKIEEDPDHPKRILTVRSVGYKFNSTLSE